MRRRVESRDISCIICSVLPVFINWSFSTVFNFEVTNIILNWHEDFNKKCLKNLMSRIKQRQRVSARGESVRIG